MLGDDGSVTERRDAFLTWAASLPGVLNTLPVITWNTDKTYLRDLASSGIPTVPTTWVGPDAGNPEILLPQGNFVVKPAVSSGAQRGSARRVAKRFSRASTLRCRRSPRTCSTR